MAKIKVHDLKPTGSELFNDSESFMSELSSDELEQAIGGGLFLFRLQLFNSLFCPFPVVVFNPISPMEL